MLSTPISGRVNVTVGDREERMMMTGLHTVADIFCVGCGSNVGWKYVSAGGTYSIILLLVFVWYVHVF